MTAIGMKFSYVGQEVDNENKVHVILDILSMETSKELMGDAEIH